MIRRADRGPSQRQLRVAEAVRHALAGVCERGEVHDPVFDRVSVTVSEVRMSPDLRQATAFVSALGGSGRPDCTEVVAALERARPFLRHRIGRMVRLKYVPELSFRADELYEQASRIDRLLADPRVRQDVAAAGDGGRTAGDEKPEGDGDGP